MNEAIKLAIEKGEYNILTIGGYYRTPTIEETMEYKSDTLLDPLFWQALGKALRWEDIMANRKRLGLEGDKGWRHHWHRFIDHIAEGKNPDDFFKELLTNSKE